MSDLRIFACGGAGINITNQWVINGNSHNIKDAKIIGVDNSTNNIPKEKNFDIEHRDNARGGGKDRAKNYPGTIEFVDSVLSRHKPGDFNIVIYSSSGASGGVLGPVIVRRLMEQGKGVISFIIGDETSQKEIDNTVKVFKSLDNQRHALDCNVVFDYINNNDYQNRGEANDTAVSRLDYLSLFLTDEHEESDYEDIQNLLRANQVTNTPPTMCKVGVYTDLTKDKDLPAGNFVGEFSLYRDPTKVAGVISGGAYRSTGIIAKNIGPDRYQSFHLLLDHDETIKHLQALLDNAQDRVTQSKERFRSVDRLSKSEGDDLNMEI